MNEVLLNNFESKFYVDKKVFILCLFTYNLTQFSKRNEIERTATIKGIKLPQRNMSPLQRLEIG